MRLLRFRCAVVFLIGGFVAVAHGQNQKSFPTDDEINLLLTQTDRALHQYSPLIEQEQTEMGKSYIEENRKDLEDLRSCLCGWWPSNKSLH